MDFLNGINRFLLMVNENWTTILVTAGLLIGLVQKIKSFVTKTNDEKIKFAKVQIRECILKLITDAELDYEDWRMAGSIKRSQVIQEIFFSYPILSKVVDQQELLNWIDSEIDNALDTLREIISINEGDPTVS